jgi:hypothetical protein
MPKYNIMKKVLQFAPGIRDGTLNKRATYLNVLRLQEELTGR